jgi:hypothetical protein
MLSQDKRNAPTKVVQMVLPDPFAAQSLPLS